MKNLYKSLLFALSITVLISCENEKDPVVSANGFNLRKISDVPTPTVLLPTNDGDVFTNLTWDISDNGVASVSKYSVIITNHLEEPTIENSVEYKEAGLVVTATERKCTLKNVEFNNLLNKLDASKCGLRDVDVRIKATLGEKNQFVNYSNPINIKVTGYSIATPILSFVKDGNTASSEPKLLSSGYTSNTDYEGYVYLQTGSYKFVRPDACGSYTSPTILGGTGSLASGTIDTSATPASIVIANTGHYLIKVNLVTNNYSIKEFRTFGVFGKATRINGTANAVPMTDNNDNIWKLTVDLIKGKSFRFKSNLWTGVTTTPDLINIGTPEIPNLIQFPPYIPPTGTTLISTLGKSLIDGQVVEVTGDNGEFTVPGTFVDNYTRQKYLIELNVSNPRKYTYTLTAK
jgi:starch-binding outer membrane protein SusE/F